MITFLLWNLNRKPLFQRVADAVRENSVDILILLESPDIDSAAIELLGMDLPFEVPTLVGKARIFSRVHPDCFYNLEPLEPDGRSDYFLLNWPEHPELIVAAVYGLDKWSTPSERDRERYLGKIRENIRIFEINKHRRGFLIGDFNVDPFEIEMVSSEGLHALIVPEVAGKRHRTITQPRTEERFFFNPTWRRFGSEQGPPATYFYNKNSIVQQCWHMPDQVVVEPEFLDDFEFLGIEILDRISDETLLNRNGQPDTRKGSDHLPLLVRIEKKGVVES